MCSDSRRLNASPLAKLGGFSQNFATAIVSFHMNVRWFMTVAGIEEDSVGVLAQDGRHRTGTAQRNVRSSDWMNAMPGTFLRLSRSSFVMNRSVPPAAAQAS